ncbi:hypothetical protein [Streptomyces sp. NBC_00140]|uniref:hypothetical protein n=1 Tax=Streptomyces sp. NBC_00140 TaxID=2975664 RepID=UPI00225B2B3E|nr:hypothetical protein [Streptomyces sp. NBC_00140]MCX5328631.1 hypothetical protein [Streptomyces sp. NBC_00140]
MTVLTLRSVTGLVRRETVADLERITARRGELDTLAGELAKQLQEVQAEREELIVAERVLNRLGLDALARGKLEPLRAKMTRLADRGRLHKRGDGRFTARL